jgi:carbonic anhydrase
MSVIDDLLGFNAGLAEPSGPGLPTEPSLRLAVLTCMDSRLDVFGALGLKIGQAHVIRNAGGIPTPDTLRSLAISQRYLGTSAIMLIQHTQCGMFNFNDTRFRQELAATGTAPPWDVPGFSDLEQNVRESVRAVADSLWLPHRTSVRGFTFEVRTSKLTEVI